MRLNKETAGFCSAKGAAIPTSTKPRHMPGRRFSRKPVGRLPPSLHNTYKGPADVPCLNSSLNRETAGICPVKAVAIQAATKRHMCRASAFLRGAQGGNCEWVNVAAFQSTIERHATLSYLVLRLNRETAGFCSAKGAAISTSTKPRHMPGWRFSRKRVGLGNA